MNQLTMFESKAMPGGTAEFPSQDITAAYHHGNKESSEANKSIKSEKYLLRQKVLTTINVHGKSGLTCDDVEKWTGLSHQTVSARFTELKAKDLIVQCGVRKTRSGRSASVWKVK